MSNAKVPVGTVITFTKGLTEPASGDHPDLLYAKKGEIGEVVGHDCIEGYWVSCDTHPGRLGASEEEFTPVPKQLAAPLKLTRRRECLGKHAIPCPECGTRQVQLVDHLVCPAKWKCRECRHKFEFEPTPYESLLLILLELRGCNDFSLVPIPLWPVIGPEYDLTQLNAQASLLNPEEVLVFIDGDVEDAEALVEKYGIPELHKFLEAVFDGDLHQELTV